jgi:hypothetical protein
LDCDPLLLNLADRQLSQNNLTVAELIRDLNSLQLKGPTTDREHVQVRKILGSPLLNWLKNKEMDDRQ